MIKSYHILSYYLFFMLFLHANAQQQTCNTYTVTAASLSAADVQTAINIAAENNGGIVFLPEGEATWDTPVFITNADVSIIGRGPGNTIINLPTDVNRFIYCNDENMNDDNANEGHIHFIQIRGIRFNAPRSEGDSKAGAIHFNRVDNYRIDHCHFEGMYHRTILLSNTPKGLIDNNTFVRSWYGEVSNPENGLAGYTIDNTGYCIVPGENHIPVAPADPIEVGKGFQAGIDARGSNISQESGYTIVSKLSNTDDTKKVGAIFHNDSSGSKSGTIARLYFFLENANVGATINIGVFEEITPNTLTTRSLLENIPVVKGMNELKIGEDFTSLEIHQGDFLGIYLNNCELAVRGASHIVGVGDTAHRENFEASWLLSGNHIPCANKNFGELSLQASPAIFAELYDSAGFMEEYEKEWSDWFTSEEAKNERNGLYHNTNWQPDDINVHCIENNTFNWFKGAVGPWSGSFGKFIIRHNYFTNGHIKYYHIILNPGTNYAIVHDNVFEETEIPYPHNINESGIYISCSGLIYNNTFTNFARPGIITGLSRTDSKGYYFPDDVRMKELYIFNNEYNNCSTFGDNHDNNNWTYDWNWLAENVSCFFRPPQATDRIYEEGAGEYNLRELTYPHPLTKATNINGFITFFDTTILQGENYYVGGDYQTTTGIYYDILQTVDGCDIIIITYLTVQNSSNAIQSKHHNQFNVYPNPTRGRITIETYPEGKSFTIQIYSSVGHLIYSKNYLDGSDKTLQQIDLSIFPPDIYCIKIISGNNINTKKIILTE